MDFVNVLVFIFVGIIAMGFIYMNFIFPKKVEKVEREANKK